MKTGSFAGSSGRGWSEMHSTIQVAEKGRDKGGAPDADATEGPAAGHVPDVDMRLLAICTDGRSEALRNIKEESHHGN